MKKEPIKHTVTWTCLECAENPTFAHADMMKHLNEVHSIDTKNCKGSRSMIQHIDCSDSYHSTYDWLIAGKKFIQQLDSPRDITDPLSWED